jgi:feruloyl-CoA synthase
LGVQTVPGLFEAPHIAAATRPSGDLLLHSTQPLGEYPVTVIHSLRSWAAQDPEHILIGERADEGSWRTCSYGAAVAAANAIGQALIDLGLSAERPLLLLSGNSVDHLLMTLGAMTAGIPVAPLSVAYSLQSHDHARIRTIAELVCPGAVFADDGERYAAALDALGSIPSILGQGERSGGYKLSALAATRPQQRLDEAFAELKPDSLAKILFTSGSTGAPKGVLNTHRMLSANQQMMRQVWPFLTRTRPVIVDWLPWSHTFGGNHNVNMMLANGGTLYVDAGRPSPGAFGQTIANLADIPPTVYFNVAAGYAQLVPTLEADDQFAARFFSRLDLMLNAAAALPGGLRDRLEAVAHRTTGRRIPVAGSWGATETGPAVTTTHYEFADARCIGTPLPGSELKLVQIDEGYEIRVKGPMVTPGYFGRPDLTAAAFDDDGFYRAGDAVTFADSADPAAGLIFRGRLAEDFKLSTGTFVRVGAVRTALLSAVQILSDAAIAGENHDCVCALAWLNPAEGVSLATVASTDDGELVLDETIHKTVAQALAEHNAVVGSAARIERLAIMTRPADMDAGEITDKGYLNQRQVLRNRADLVDLLYAEPPPPGVVVAGRYI